MNELANYINESLQRTLKAKSNNVSIYLEKMSESKLKKLRIIFPDWNIERDYFGYYKFVKKEQ